MSDNIPFEIQLEIIKKVSDAKSLIRFRSVSKPWRSFIDSSEFIARYGARETQLQSFLLRYKHFNEEKYVCVADDNSSEEKYVCFAPNVYDPMQQLNNSLVIGSSNGLLFEYGLNDYIGNDLEIVGSSHCLLCLRCYEKDMLVLWNPSIRKSVSIKLPNFPSRDDFLGFTVCPVNNDPTIVMITYPWQVEIFTLSSKRCTEFRYTKLPPKLISPISSHIVIDSCIYWAAREFILSMDGLSRFSYMIMSFDLIAKEIRLVNIPHSCILNNPLPEHFFISKLRGSLVLFVSNKEVEIPVCGVWKMDHDESFTKLFTISTPDCTINNILGFRMNGELVMETQEEDEEFAELKVYDPHSERISNLEIYGDKGSFFMDSYKETLLLLNHSNGCVYPDLN